MEHRNDKVPWSFSEKSLFYGQNFPICWINVLGKSKSCCEAFNYWGWEGWRASVNAVPLNIDGQMERERQRPTAPLYPATETCLVLPLIGAEVREKQLLWSCWKQTCFFNCRHGEEMSNFWSLQSQDKKKKKKRRRILTYRWRKITSHEEPSKRFCAGSERVIPECVFVHTFLCLLGGELL